MPALAATSATPEPMSPEPTIPSCLTVILVPPPDAPGTGESAGYYASNLRCRPAGPGGESPVGSATDESQEEGRLARIGGRRASSEPGAATSMRELVAASGAGEVVVLPTAAAYEHPERVG